MSTSTTEPPVRVVLADDQPLVRTALRMVMTDTPDLVVTGEAADGATGAPGGIADRSG